MVWGKKYLRGNFAVYSLAAHSIDVVKTFGCHTTHGIGSDI